VLEAEAQGIVLPELEPPKLAVENVDPSGTFGIFFNSDVSGLQFLEKLNKGLASRGSIEDTNGRRLLGSSHIQSGRHLQDEAFSLEQFLTFSIQRGGEDSADASKLGFVV